MTATLVLLLLRTSAVEKGLMMAGEGLLEGGVKAMDSTDLHPCIAALATSVADRHFIVAVMTEMLASPTRGPRTRLTMRARSTTVMRG